MRPSRPVLRGVAFSAMDGYGSDIPPREPERAQEDDSVVKNVKPGRDGPPEVEDAAEQEVEYPADETDEG